MNTQELRNKIDNILGNSLRVLLPSYWWKKLFHHVADTIDGNEQLIIESFKEFEKKHPDIASRTFYITLDENSEEAAHNTQLCRQLFINLLMSVEIGTKFHNDPYYLAVPLAEDEESLAYDVRLIACPQYSFAEGGVAFWDVGIGEKQYFVIFSVFGNGIPEIAPVFGSTNITVDSSLSTTSTNPVQNKVVTEAIKNVVPTFGITKTQGFAEYFLALSANQSNPNMYPRGIVIYENAQSEVDNVIGLNNGTEIGIEFSVAEKRYRWVFNQASGAFIREEQISSGSSTAGGLETRSFKSTNSTTDKEWNKETISLFLEGKVSIVYSYPAPNGVLPEGTSIDLMPNIHIYQNGTHQFWFTEQHPSGGHTNYIIAIQSDGTYDDDVEEFNPDTEMSDTSTNTVQNKVVKAYVDDSVKTYELNLVNLNTFDKIEAAIAALNLPDSVDITRQLKITDNYANHFIIKSDLYPLANISESVITFNCIQGLRIIAKKEDQSVNRMMCSDAIIHIGTTDGNYNKNNTAIFPSTVKDPTEAFADFSIHYHTKDNTLIECKPLNVLRGYETSEEEPTYYQFDVIVNGCRETWRVNSDGSCICEKVANMDIDTVLSDSSTNLVQNKVIKAYVDESIATSITNALNTEV